MEFLRALVKANISKFKSSNLLQIFLEQETSHLIIKADSSHHKQSFYSLAKCIAIISVGSSPSEAINVANMFSSELTKIETLTDANVVIALLSIGEIGRHV